MPSRALFAVALAGSMLLTAVPAREAACQQDGSGKPKKNCPRNEKCFSNADCKQVQCGLTCQPADDRRGGMRRVCL